ncbi:hypothetical protein V8G54_025267 [Vigna mungo]|uniref:Ty3/gypsy retrotransposon protein n=1 Tax=Vigna mungo TaxID=3915 RepID=A0AAQ3N8Y3_VIGMU
MTTNTLSPELSHILEILEKRDRDHAREMTELRNELADFKANIQGFTHPLQARNVNLDFPKFDGSVVLQWIFRAEQSLELEFGPSPFDSPRVTLFKLTQTGSVNYYYVEFTSLANRIYGVSAEALLDCFVSGLKPDIKCEVIAQAPSSILKAIALARLFEEKYSAKTKPQYVSYHRQYHSTNSQQSFTNPMQQPILATPNTRPTAPSFRNSLIKKMSPTEMQSRRERGLCFTCDEKFSATHRCQNRQYLIMQLEEEEKDAQELEEDVVNLEDELAHYLSFSALKGSAGTGTMRFTGTIAGKDVQILLDSGSSDNFLQPNLAKFLKLPVEPTSGLQVLPVYLLSVSGADLVLGAAWLATLGPHIADYRSLTIKFYKDKKLVTLVGEKQQPIGVAQFHQLKRLSHTQSIAEIFTLQLCSNFTTQYQWTTSLQDMDPEITLLLHTYKGIFAKPVGLPPSRSQDHKIPLLQGSAAVKVRPYKYPHSKKQQIEIMVKEMLDEGIIVPSSSPFSSPIILVKKKKDGTWRFCTDYRALDAITVKDSFPIPTVEELLDELFGAKYFSKLDLRAGYHQILVNEEDRYKTTFRTHQGHYEWLVMPFGLTNASTTFQNLMNYIFQGLLRKSVLVFFDDILVYSASWSTHLHHLQQVLQILEDHKLYAKMSKCSFGLEQIDYLGHIVSSRGVQMKDTKIQVVLQWLVPKTIKQLRGFLGLTGYYRRFIKGYATIVNPLTNLLKKDNFKWSNEASNAFLALKNAITTAPVLSLLDFSKPFVLETYASGPGIGAVLSQDRHPIAFFSKKLFTRLAKQSTYTREFYAITEAIAKIRHYLLGHKFIIRTDQKSLKALMDQSLQTPEQQAWLHKFLGYNFTIEYKPRKENLVVDALSRSFFMACSQVHNDLIPKIKVALPLNPKLQTIITDCAQGKLIHSHYSWLDGILYWKDRIVVPSEQAIKDHILSEYHSSPFGGHFRIARTMARVSAQFFWKNMHKDIMAFTQQCRVCQQAKTSTTLPAGLLQPLPIPHQIWEDITMDFIVGLPPSEGFTVIFVIVNRLSKYAHFAPLKSDFNSKKVAEVFLFTVVKLHGFPNSIVSNRDKVFTSSFWQHLLKLSGTTLNLSTAYHPQSDGQSEVVNKCLKMYLRCFTYETPKAWLKFLPWAEYWYNTSYHHSTQMTPFRIVYGRDPPTLLKYHYSSIDPPSIQDMLQQRDVILAQLKLNLLKAQERMKKYANQKRVYKVFEVGDSVLVKLHPYRQHSVALRKIQKLGLRYFGPFPIMQKIGTVAYKLLLPPHAKIHPIFHASQLKLYKVLRQREIMRGTTTVTQILIQWEGLGEHDATWEDKEDIVESYSSFNLEDKISFKGGSIVTSGNEEEGHITKIKSKIQREQSQEENRRREKVVNMQGQVSPPKGADVAEKEKRVRHPNARLRGYLWKGN